MSRVRITEGFVFTFGSVSGRYVNPETLLSINLQVAAVQISIVLDIY